MVDRKRQERRIKLAQRQVALAKIARREAMTALAEAVEEEARSANLYERSRVIAESYANGPSAISAQSLKERVAFLNGLRDIGAKAERARGDASDQAEWQRQSLSVAERRSARFEENVQSAKRAIEAQKENREHSPIMKLARKLHSLG